jgi:lysophospholipase L1-like esterase
MPEGSTQVKLSVTRGTVRIFGVSFEKKTPGVVYHSLGLNGASVQMLLMHFDTAQWTEHLRHMNPDLVVLNYGSNESFFGGYLDSQYPRDVRQMIQRTREALPDASILVMSPMDRGDRNSEGEIVTPPAVPRVIEVQRRVAIEEGCAFFNTFEAMGGSGTMARWYNDKPRMVSADFLHPLPQGAAKVGALVEKALVAEYLKWKAGRQ